MKAAVIGKNLEVTIQNVAFPVLPTPDHLIIKVVVSGMNPKDWAMAERFPGSHQGDDISGIVHSVGRNVTDFRPGDRVCSFHEMLSPHGSFGEYAVGLADTTFHLPENVSFEEGATIPLAAMTAALGLYQRLGLPPPWLAAQRRLPLVIYGASSAVGAFAVKLAMLSNIHPLICIAGKGGSYVETLIDRSRNDIVIDHREGSNAIIHKIQNALEPGEKLQFAFDAVTDKGSYQNLGKVLDAYTGRMTVVLARKKYEGVPESVELTYTQVGRVHSPNYPGLKGEKPPLGELGDEDFGAIGYKFIGRGLKRGWFKGHPFQVVPQGLNGLQLALHKLKNGQASAFKYVVRISDTPDLDKAQL